MIIKSVKCPALLQAFNRLDDHDGWASSKGWAGHHDFILATLSTMLLQRRLFKIAFFDQPAGDEILQPIREELSKTGLSENELSYFIITGETTNYAYEKEQDPICVKMKNGELLDIADASDIPTIEALTKIVRKYYVCWGKNVSLRQ